MSDRIAERLYEMFQLGMLGAFGGLANYVYITVQREQQFSWWRMLVNLFLAFFVGNFVGSIVPESTFKDGIMMAAGFCTYPILNVLEVQSKKALVILADRALNKWIGTTPRGADDATPPEN